MRKRVSLLFWQHLWLVPDEEAGTLKLRKISRHYRILGSVMSPVFLVSWCFKNTHHMSFSPDVMHIFCQSPTSLLTIIFLLHSLGSLFLRDTSALLWSQQNRKFDISVPEEISPPLWRWRLWFTTAGAGGEPHKTVWSQIYLAGMQIRMNNCQPRSWDVSHQASTTVSSDYVYQGLILDKVETWRC